MLILLLVATVILLALGATVAYAQFGLWGQTPVEYRALDSPELHPFFRSWGEWLENRGRIVVGHAGTPFEVEFRKRRWRTRADTLVFRVRNANGNREHFSAVHAALDAAGVQYEFERTHKRRQIRALAVGLNPSDVHTPAAAAHLVVVAFGALAVDQSEFKIRAEGRLRRSPDVPAVALIPPRQDMELGYRIGSWLGRALSRIRGSGLAA